MAIIIPYVKQTWTDGPGGGTPESAARLGVIEEGILDCSRAPAVRTYHAANVSITSATVTAIGFATGNRYDQAGGAASTQHSTSVNNTRLTCLYAGIYRITAQASFAANATGFRQLSIRLNGTTYIGSQNNPTPSATNPSLLNATTEYALAVNDYVEMTVYQNSGAGLNILFDANLSPEFMWVRVA
jgi:hypothetical protein